MALFAPSLILHPGLQGHLFFFPLCLSLSLSLSVSIRLTIWWLHGFLLSLNIALNCAADWVGLRQRSKHGPAEPGLQVVGQGQN